MQNFINSIENEITGQNSQNTTQTFTICTNGNQTTIGEKRTFKQGFAREDIIVGGESESEEPRQGGPCFFQEQAHPQQAEPHPEDQEGGQRHDRDHPTHPGAEPGAPNTTKKQEDQQTTDDDFEAIFAQITQEEQEEEGEKVKGLKNENEMTREEAANER